MYECDVCMAMPCLCESVVPHAVRDVLAERVKQRAKWGDHHDDAEHGDGELAFAASFLALDAEPMSCTPDWIAGLKLRHSPRERLVIAAALLIAEIERLDRLTS